MTDPHVAFRITIDPSSDALVEISLPEKPVHIAEIVPFLHFITDQIVKTAINHSTHQVTCGKGCGVCCNQLVPLSIPEVFFIVEQLQLMPPQQRFPYLSRFEAIEQHLIKT
ncbi:MAG TPA: hypothetical protein VHO70_17510 [Chitinispirillaceae bacterium]|nr:hypothetical protein [Chitinispirillaceae bacterium]